MSGFGFPYRVGRDGRTASADRQAHVRGLIEQILFTRQGERVNRPEFGAGVHDLVFTENTPEISAAVQHVVQSALQRWLAEAVEVRGVEARAQGATLSITVRYRALDEAELRELKIVREV